MTILFLVRATRFILSFFGSTFDRSFCVSSEAITVKRFHAKIYTKSFLSLASSN